MRRLLGCFNFYRNFIAGYSAISSVLSDAVRKSAPIRVKRTPERERAVEALKASLTSAPLLKGPDFSKPFILEVDSSDRCIGCVLSQLDDNGEKRPILYLSKKLSDRQVRGYSTVEKEAMAMLYSLGKLKYYLLGKEFTIYSDSKALEWINQNASKNAKIYRWSLALAAYDFKVIYKKGSLNLNADFLSRLPK
jgi:hypothetical protein